MFRELDVQQGWVCIWHLDEFHSALRDPALDHAPAHEVRCPLCKVGLVASVRKKKRERRLGQTVTDSEGRKANARRKSTRSDVRQTVDEDRLLWVRLGHCVKRRGM